MAISAIYVHLPGPRRVVRWTPRSTRLWAMDRLGVRTRLRRALSDATDVSCSVAERMRRARVGSHRIESEPLAGPLLQPGLQENYEISTVSIDRSRRDMSLSWEELGIS